MIALGIPVGESIQPETLSSLLELVRDNDIKEFIVKQSPLVHLNREKIVIQALRTNCTHLLFIDTDMKFGSLILKKLLAHKKDIVGLIYRFKSIPTKPVVYIKKGKFLDEVPRKLFKVYAIGTGCLLIKLSVFKKIKQPWFFFGKQTKRQGGYGEDIWFCNQARKAGFDIWCDGQIEVGHIGKFIY